VSLIGVQIVNPITPNSNKTSHHNR